MTDEEFVEGMSNIHSDASWKRLIALARIGAAVKPRPIEEAPNRQWVDAWCLKAGQYINGLFDPFDARWVLRDGSSLVENFGEPTHFIPLSALPTPEAEE